MHAALSAAVAGANGGTQLAHEVEECGIVVPPGNTIEMADAVRRLKAEPDLRLAMGRNAIERVNARWTKSAILSQFEKELATLAKSS